MQLSNGEAVAINGGRFAYLYEVGTGTGVTLEFKTDISDFQEIEGFFFNANANGTIDIPGGELRATLDGTGRLFINRVK